MHHNELDRIDLKILDVLQSNGRITNQKLAELVSLSPSACLKRLHMLESAGLITGYHASVALGQVRPTMEVWAEITMKKHMPSAFKRFEAIISRVPEIVEISRVTGPFDYLLKVIVADMAEWKDISLRMLGEAHGVANLMSIIVMEEVKPFTGVPITSSSSRSNRPDTRSTLFSHDMSLPASGRTNWQPEP